MGGPPTEHDAAPAGEDSPPPRPTIEVAGSREAQVGGFRVQRALPRRGRRTVGAWCFLDQLGPASVSPERGLDVAPHPHLGLHTVTWLFTGEVVHRDSLGSEQVIRPGQVNLMTAGHGISHSEEGTGRYAGGLEGVQLWIAQPSDTRNGAPAFAHHPELPEVEMDGSLATVLIGEVAGHRSPARRDTDLVGIDLQLHGPDSVVPLRPEFEHGLMVCSGHVTIEGRSVGPGQFAYLGRGREEFRLVVEGSAQVMVLGGTPFDEPLVMWWNFVGRSRDEITEAHREWSAGGDRFGTVASALPRVEIGPPPWNVSGS